MSVARTARTAGNLGEALVQAQSAIDTIESVRTGVVSPELRAMFLASKQDYYELQIDTLMTLHTADPQKGFAAEAFKVSEQARARSLLEILQESKILFVGKIAAKNAGAVVGDHQRVIRYEGAAAKTGA